MKWQYIDINIECILFYLQNKFRNLLKIKIEISQAVNLKKGKPKSIEIIAKPINVYYNQIEFNEHNINYFVVHLKI